MLAYRHDFHAGNHADVLKHLAATDEKRRNELRTLRARTRTLRLAANCVRH